MTTVKVLRSIPQPRTCRYSKSSLMTMRRKKIMTKLIPMKRKLRMSWKTSKIMMSLKVRKCMETKWTSWKRRTRLLEKMRT